MAEGGRPPMSPEDPRVQNARELIDALDLAGEFDEKPMPSEEELIGIAGSTREPAFRGDRRRPGGEQILSSFIQMLASPDTGRPGSYAVDISEEDPEIEVGTRSVVHYFLRGEKPETFSVKTDDPNVERYRDGKFELSIARHEVNGKWLRTFTLQRLELRA